MSAHRAARLQKWRLQAGLTPQGFSSPPRTGASRLGGCKKPQRDPPRGGDAAWGHHSLGSPLRVSEILLGKLEHRVRWESQAVLPAVRRASPDWGTLQEGQPPHPAQSERAQCHPRLTVPRPSHVGPLPPQWPGPADPYPSLLSLSTLASSVPQDWTCPPHLAPPRRRWTSPAGRPRLVLPHWPGHNPSADPRPPDPTGHASSHLWSHPNRSYVWLAHCWLKQAAGPQGGLLLAEHLPSPSTVRRTPLLCPPFGPAPGSSHLPPAAHLPGRGSGGHGSGHGGSAAPARLCRQLQKVGGSCRLHQLGREAAHTPMDGPKSPT